MDNILRAISNAKSTGDLYPVLDVLSIETKRIVNTQPLNAEEARLLARYLTEIRFLLTEMAGSNNGPGRNNGAVAAERLAALYGEIEGKVKEMRNDLAGKRTGLPRRNEDREAPTRCPFLTLSPFFSSRTLLSCQAVREPYSPGSSELDTYCMRRWHARCPFYQQFDEPRIDQGS